jgi:hypothetical protein
LTKIPKQGYSPIAVSEQLPKTIPRELPGDLMVERLKWKRQNFGVLARVARDTGFSKVYVTYIFQGIKSNKAVEQLLGDAGAPGFSSSTEAS